jgi:hypothetical protein
LFILCAVLYSLAVLRIQDSDGIHNLGTPQWQLILCIAFVYCLLYLSLFKVSSVGYRTGNPQWQLILCIAFVYCLLYLSLFKVSSVGYRTGNPQWQLILCIAFVYCLLYLSLFKVSSARYIQGPLSGSSSSALPLSTASSTCLYSR